MAKLYYILVILISIVNMSEISAQSETKADDFILQFYGHEAYPRPKPIIEDKRLSLPFKRAGNLIFIEAFIDGTYGDFILDTGAPHLVLNKKYFPNAPYLASIEGAGITGGISKVIQSKVKEIDFGGLRFVNVHTDLIDLSHLEERKGENIFGLLGISLFSKFEMIIDYQAAVIILHPLGKKGVRMLEDSLTNHIDLQPKIPLEINHKVIIVEGEINQKKLRFCLDTGAESNVINANLSRKVLDGVEIIRKVNVSGAGAKRSEALLGNIKTLRLGNRQFDDMRTTVMNLSGLSQIYGTYIDGMLGYDFLVQSTVCINFYKEEMSIW
ncbi:MAG: aspartyl protease family protein [Flavobacteriales bacterium]